MVNLLSETRLLARRYLLRFVTVASLALALALALGGALLVPSFFLARATAEAGERYLAALEDIVGLRERAGVARAVASDAERLSVMESYARPPVFSPLLSALSSAIPRGVILTSVSVARAGGETAVSVGGSASTRSALLSFADALRTTPAFSVVALPVGALASESDIPFTISFAYTPSL